MNLIISTLLILLLTSCSSAFKIGMGDYTIVVSGEIEVVNESTNA